MHSIHFNSQKLSILFVLLYIIIYYFTIMFIPNHHIKYIVTGVLSLLGPVIASIFLWINMKAETKTVEKNFILLLITGLFSYIIGELIWDVHLILFQAEPSFPHISDLFFLLQSVIFLVAFVYLVFQNKRFVQRAVTIVDIIITTIVMITISSHFLIQRLFDSDHIFTLEIMLSIAYPIIDFLILFGIFHCIYFLQLRTFSKKMFLFIGIAMCIVTVADTIFLIQTAFDSYNTGNLVDPLWSIGYLLIGSSFMFTGLKEKQSQTSGYHHKLGDSYLLPIIVVGLLLLVFIQYIPKIEPLLLGLVLCFLLLFIRQYIILRENIQLNKLLRRTSEQLQEKNKELEKTVNELEILNKHRSLEARTDFLTGTYNRRYIDHLIRTMINDRMVDKQMFSILLIDVDHFKLVNDMYGHDIGDIVLKKLAEAFQACIRKSDTLGRIGGEEFMIILPKADLSESIGIAERIQKRVEENTINYQDYKIPITVSIGLTVWESTDNFDSIYRRADEALYNAKVDRNSIVVKTTFDECKVK